MDADRFDALSRSLSRTPSRRSALRLLAGSVFGSLFTLGAVETDAHDALKKCKKKSGKQKKKCLKKAKAHNATHVTQTPPITQTPPSCTPNCSGKNCGSDGCGGSCGACTVGTCTGGTCVCQSGEEVCRGTCVSDCSAFTMSLNPMTCECCQRPAFECSAHEQCCTGTCLSGAPSFPRRCSGVSAGGTCQFDGQCSTGFCIDGTCGCPAGRVVCAGGAGCSQPCQSGQVHQPGTCGCCAINGQSCGASLPVCCAGQDQCIDVTCHGLEDGDACTFDEQCASQFGCNGGQCGLAVGS